MKILLVLSSRAVHRSSNLQIYAALKKQLPELFWSSGTPFDMYTMAEQGHFYLDKVDTADAINYKRFPGVEKFAFDAFDIAIIDQSLDLSQDQSPSMFGGGIANRSLDHQGVDRPSELIAYLTGMGTICIGTSRNGVCLDELAQHGAVLTTPLEELVERLPALIAESERLIRTNQLKAIGGLRALTLRQPFAWSIFKAGKDVENRTWPTKVRGTIAIHAAADQPAASYENSKKFIRSVQVKLGVKGLRIPASDRLDRGAIIGLVDVVDCVTQSQSAWFEGPIGFTLANPRLLPYAIPCPGQRRFFTVPFAVEREIYASLR